MNHVFLGLGSNVDAERNLRRAVQLLARRCRLLAVSPVYQTEPVGAPDGPPFLNAAALIETELSAAGLKTGVLGPVEVLLGRVRTADKNAPRTIDLDIALFGDEILDLGSRHIPDPDILRFAYLAVPLAALAPHHRHPETGETLLAIAQRLDHRGITPRPDVLLAPQAKETIVQSLNLDRRPGSCGRATA